MDGSIDTTDYQMDQIFDTLNKVHHDSYLRIDVPKGHRKYEADMADASPENIKKLKTAGKNTVEHFKDHLDNFISRLINEED